MSPQSSPLSPGGLLPLSCSKLVLPLTPLKGKVVEVPAQETKVTSPLKLISCCTAPVLVADNVPLYVLTDKPEAKRTYIVVVATVPPVSVRVTDEPKPEPDVVETSKSAGAVMVMSSVKLLPSAVKVCSAEGPLPSA